MTEADDIFNEISGLEESRERLLAAKFQVRKNVLALRLNALQQNRLDLESGLSVTPILPPSSTTSTSTQLSESKPGDQGTAGPGPGEKKTDQKPEVKPEPTSTSTSRTSSTSSSATIAKSKNALQKAVDNAKAELSRTTDAKKKADLKSTIEKLEKVLKTGRAL